MSPEVSRDITDEEILQYARTKDGKEDPEGDYLLRKFRANQIMSSLTRGAIQMGTPAPALHTGHEHLCSHSGGPGLPEGDFRSIYLFQQTSNGLGNP